MQYKTGSRVFLYMSRQIIVAYVGVAAIAYLADHLLRGEVWSSQGTVNYNQVRPIYLVVRLGV